MLQENKHEQQTNNPDVYPAIPIELPQVDGWKEVPLRENDDPLVAIGSFSGNEFDQIFTSSVYYGEHSNSPYARGQLEGALVTTFARKEVAGQILEADRNLPKGMHIMVLDSYRTLDVQQALYNNYLASLKKQNPDMNEDELSRETQKFVSIPSTDPSKPSPHNTGGAIDVAIYSLPPEIEEEVEGIKERISQIGDDPSNANEVYLLEMQRISLVAKNAEMLNFGTKWDHGGPESALNYYEVLAEQRKLTSDEQEAQNNRRLLYKVMVEVGLEPYAEEWWHYNSKKSQMGAKTAGIDHAEYGAVELSENNMEHEQNRVDHIKGNETVGDIPDETARRLARTVPDLTIVREGANVTGHDIRSTSLPEVAVIEAPEKKAA